MTLPRDVVKKASAKFSAAWHTTRPVASVPKMAATLGTAAWMRGQGATCPILSSPPFGFFTGYTQLLTVLWAGRPIELLRAVLRSCLLVPQAPHPGQFILLNNEHSSRGSLSWLLSS